MAAIISIKIDVKKLDKSKFYVGEKGTYATLDVTINNELSTYGKQGYVCLERSKEERGVNAPKVFVGDATVQWTDGSIITTRELQDGASTPPGSPRPQAPADDGDIPF